jgi:gas vesicle protein
MRFVIGLLLGFGIGFAGAILFAPEKNKKEREWTPRSHGDTPAGNGLVSTVRERVSEAMGEAREAKKQAERDMMDRYERTVGRKSEEN